MDRVIIDTSAVVALFDKKDYHHARVSSLFEKIFRGKIKVVITDYILSECITTILMRTNHDTAVKSGEFILESKVIELVWLDELLKRKAWEYFKRHSDKMYSFTDCTSFALMREENIRRYLAFDDHFKQAGFVEFS